MYARSSRLLTLLAAVIWLVPLLLLAIAAWQNWRILIVEEDGEIRNVLTVLAEQTEQVFQSQAVVLRWIDRHVQGWTWDEIENSTELPKLIASLHEGSDYIDSVYLVDEYGRIRTSERHFPMANGPRYVSDRAYFVDAKNGTPNTLHIGGLEQSKGRGQFVFQVVRRRSSPEGSFDGIIAARLSPSHFENLFSKIINTTAGAVTIFRDDGKILARTTAIARNASLTDGESSFGVMTFRSPESTTFTSPVDNVQRFGAVSKLRNYPAFVSFAIDMKAIRKEWLDRVMPFAVVAIGSSLILILLTLYVRRIARREEVVQQAWQDEVTNRLQREAQVRQALKMEALGRLAGGVAHHFNNLLPAMSGLLEMTRAEVPADSSAAKRLSRMIDAVSQGRNLVRQILTFSHRNVARREKVQTSALIDDALALAKGSLPKTICLLQNQHCDVALFGDSVQLRDVLLNLISNAVHAIGADYGTITISTEIFSVNAEAARRLAVPKGQFVKIECNDDGAGMSENVKEHAFEPFFTTKPQDEGFGLGLSIVHGVIVGHGGAIEFDSSLGKGCRFSIYLPILTSA